MNETAVDFLKWLNSHSKKSVLICAQHDKEIGLYCERDHNGLCYECIPNHFDHMNETLIFKQETLVYNIQDCITFLKEKQEKIS